MKNETLAGYEGQLRADAWLTVHPVDPASPEEVLLESSYRSLQRIQEQVRVALKD